MPKLRPRISVLTALLLMTILSMALVIVHLWHELVPMRAELRALRDETGRLSIDDPTKVQAMQVRITESLTWKWRVWVPKDMKVNAMANWGTVPYEGVPTAQCGVELGAGEQWVTLTAVHNSTDGNWYAEIETNGSGSGVKIDPKDYWWEGPPRAMAAPGVGFQTGKANNLNEPFVLYRYHIGDPSVTNSSDLTKPGPPTTGFIIWLEPAK